MAEVELIDMPVEVRSVSAEPERSAVLRVCQYGETSHRTDRPERFVSGAFTKSVSARGDRIAFTTRHTDGTGKIAPGTNVGRPVAWDTSDPGELRATLKFFDNPEGWEAFYRARDGELDGASVGFRPVQERSGSDGAREVVEAALHHVALLSRAETVPAYDAPRLLEVRVDVQALLSKQWDPDLAERHVSADHLAVLISRVTGPDVSSPAPGDGGRPDEDGADGGRKAP